MIKVTEDLFDVALELKKLQSKSNNIGAMVAFTGLVREDDLNSAINNNASKITHLELEHYPSMTEKSLEDIEKEANNRFELINSIIIHRYGKLAIGEPIVLVITCSAHRKDAFDAANFMMDQLKTRATFWKRQISADDNKWVEAKKSDQEASSNWKS